MKMHTPDLTAQNIEKLAALFPSCVTEARDEATGKLKRAIDFDQLRQELSGHVVEGPRERYHLDWPGKREALLAANAPIAKTLRPCREESVDFDTTKNLFIEGDNLDALKLLQETYLGKVKMIYIDPPYNTGNDFIYEDDFAQDAESYLQQSKQKDGAGNRLVTNTEANGRFHSDWLTMLYSRLKLARNLLDDSGVLLSSLDDNEIANFRKLGDEVFGADCFLFQITMLCNPKGRALDKYIANCHEYLIAYSKTELPKGALNIPKDEEEVKENYRLKDERGPYRELELRNTHREFGKHNRANLWYPFYVDSQGNISLTKDEKRTEVLPYWDDGFEGCWTWGKDKATKQLNEIVARKQKGDWKIYRKNYAFGEDGEATKQVKSIWIDPKFHTEKGQSAFNDLFDFRGKIFQAPKSVDTLKQALLMTTARDGVVLDFFSGSGTTAHAVIAQNALDGGTRQFIMVQIADPCSSDSDAFKAGYKTIADISKERIRRAGAKVLEEWKAKQVASSPKKEDQEDLALVAEDPSSYKIQPSSFPLDIGFRVLKIDTSNMADVYYAPDAVKQADLVAHTDNIKADRTPEDLLFQVLVDWGIDLSLRIERFQMEPQMDADFHRLKAETEICENLADKKSFTVFFVDENALAACFDANITEDLVKAIARRKPLRAVFRDSSFDSDSTKINVEQIFKLLSPGTELRSL
jgi:adenine-specific DNA-methyltransferase